MLDFGFRPKAEADQWLPEAVLRAGTQLESAEQGDRAPRSCGALRNQVTDIEDFNVCWTYSP